MLKTRRQDRTWLVSQPDHAQVAGYLAARWGNKEFARPGYFAVCPDPKRLRGEIVFGIAEHDNGWWEWEATPELAEADSLPLSLAEVLKNQQDGMNRWRLGIPRFSRDHPYASLLISFHAYWLYTHGIQTDSDLHLLIRCSGKVRQRNSWGTSSTLPVVLLAKSKRFRTS